jgi:hypothetical protein
MYFNLKAIGRKPPAQLPILLEAFKKSPRGMPQNRIAELTAATKLDERQLARWWRHQQQCNKPPTLQKFEEAFWRCFFYTVSFIWGAYVCFSAPHFYDTELLWVNNLFSLYTHRPQPFIKRLFTKCPSKHFSCSHSPKINNPLHHVPRSVYWYYVTELGLYLSLLVSQFFDIRRKDFAQVALAGVLCSPHRTLTCSYLAFDFALL